MNLQGDLENVALFSQFINWRAFVSVVWVKISIVREG